MSNRSSPIGPPKLQSSIIEISSDNPDLFEAEKTLESEPDKDATIRTIYTISSANSEASDLSDNGLNTTYSPNNCLQFTSNKVQKHLKGLLVPYSLPGKDIICFDRDT